MKVLPAIFLLLLVAFSATPGQAQTQDLMNEAQRLYLAGELAAAKERFKLVLQLDRNNKPAQNYLRMINAAEARSGVGGQLQKQLQALVLPRVELRDATFGTAVDYLKQQAAKETQGKLNVSIVMQLPDEFVNTKKVTLALSQVPFTEALRYICDLVGARYSIEKHAVVVRKTGDAAPADAAGTTSPAPVAQ